MLEDVEDRFAQALRGRADGARGGAARPRPFSRPPTIRIGLTAFAAGGARPPGPFDGPLPGGRPPGRPGEARPGRGAAAARLSSRPLLLRTIELSLALRLRGGPPARLVSLAVRPLETALARPSFALLGARVGAA